MPLPLAFFAVYWRSDTRRISLAKLSQSLRLRFRKQLHRFQTFSCPRTSAERTKKHLRVFRLRFGSVTIEASRTFGRLKWCSLKPTCLREKHAALGYLQERGHWLLSTFGNIQSSPSYDSMPPKHTRASQYSAPQCLSSYELHSDPNRTEHFKTADCTTFRKFDF